jgi:hypothetical protein
MEKEVPVEKKALGTDLFLWGRRIVVQRVLATLQGPQQNDDALR